MCVFLLNLSAKSALIVFCRFPTINWSPKARWTILEHRLDGCGSEQRFLDFRPYNHGTDPFSHLTYAYEQKPNNCRVFVPRLLPSKTRFRSPARIPNFRMFSFKKHDLFFEQNCPRHRKPTDFTIRLLLVPRTTFDNIKCWWVLCKIITYEKIRSIQSPRCTASKCIAAVRHCLAQVFPARFHPTPLLVVFDTAPSSLDIWI